MMILTLTCIAKNSRQAKPILLSIPFRKRTNKPGASDRWYFPPLLAVILMLSSLAANAVTYYIAPNGNNAANGSITTPWQTLAYACSKVTSQGDIIHVNVGTYNETARANLTPGVSIVGEGMTSIIKTSYVAASLDDAAILLNSSSLTNGSQSISNIKIDGSNLTATRGVLVNNRSNVTIHDCSISNFNNSGVRFYCGHWRSSVNTPAGIYASGNAMYNCISDNNAITVGHDWAASQIWLNGQDGFLFYNNTCTAKARAAGMNGIIIRGDGNIGLKIYNNTFNKNDQEGSEWNFFFELWYWQGGGEIHDNTFNGAATTDLCDIRKGSSAYGIKVYNNKFLVNALTTNSPHGIQAIDFEDHGVIESVYVNNNYFKNVPNGVSIDALIDEADTRVDINNIYIYSNLFDNIGLSDGNYTFPIVLSANGSNSNIFWDKISIYNNTMTASTTRRTFSGIRWHTGGTATNISIRNNIIQGFATSPISFAVGIAGGTINNLSVENNLYYNNASNSTDFGPITVTNKTEQNNGVSNPLFVSSTDFHLQSTSPAKDAGINVGLPFIGSAPDVGAYEYSGATGNQVPQIQNQSFQINENSPNGSPAGIVVATDPDAGQTLTYSILSGNTNNAFAINGSTGAITVATSSALNFEVTSSFALVVKVLDNGTGNLSSQATVTVNLINVNEPPVLNNQTFSILEHTANGILAGTVLATDPDAGQTCSFAITSGNTGNAFSINSTSGAITVGTSAALDFLISPVFSLHVRVTDNGAGNLFADAIITINLTQSSNLPPVITNQTFSITENSANGTNVGTVIATDPDAGQTLTYSILSGNTNGAFAISATAGILTVANSSALNYQTTPSFALVIKVQDNGTGNLSSQSVETINLYVAGSCTATGNISCQVWNNIGIGEAVSLLTSNINYPSNPTSTTLITSMEGATDLADNYGTRIAGYICAPATGNYTFWIASDDNGELWLSTDDQPANKQKIAFHNSNTDSREWNKFPTQKSSTILLVQGHTYYVEALMKEGDGGDNLAVGWLKPGQTGTEPSEVIPGTVLSPLSVAANHAPTISNQSFSINENSSNGSTVGTVAAGDPDTGQTLTYSIVSGNTNNAFTINSSTGAVIVANTSALNYEAIPSFALTVKVQDNGTGSLSSQATVSVNLLNMNEAPVVINQTYSIPEGAAIGTLVGTVLTSDPDAGQTRSILITSGNTSNAFSINGTTGAISVAASAPLNYLVNPAFSINIRVTDNGTGNLFTNAILTVNVAQSSNQPPVITNQTFSVNEHSPKGTIAGKIIASDPNAGQKLSYSILSGNTNNAFSLDASTGYLTIADSAAVNYETLSSYAIVVKVTDDGSGNLSSQAVTTETVLNVNEPPAIGNQAFQVNENALSGTPVGSIIASDADAGQTITYSILSGNSNNAFAINSATGALSVLTSSALNYEAAASFVLVVKVQDNGTGTLSRQAVVTVSVNNVNEPPAVSNQAFSVSENASNGTLVGSVFATDPDAGQTKSYTILSGNTNNAFAINASTGAITVGNISALNYELVTSFALVVKVQDNGTGNLSSQAIITVSILNVNEPPVINNQSFSIPEHAANGSLVGTVSATDPDAGQTRSFAIISGNTSNAFAINASTGAITVSISSALNFLVNPVYAIKTRVTDNGSGNLAADATITINLTQGTNQPPVINNQKFSVRGHSPKGKIAGVVVATDPNSGQTLNYSIISGKASSAFILDAVNGNLIIADSAALSYEIPASYDLIVKVQDNGTGNLSNQATVTITIEALTTSINNSPGQAAASRMHIYPNPVTNGILNVKLDDDIDEQFDLTIMDLSGKTLTSRHYEQAGSFSIDVSAYPPSLYLIQIRSKNYRFTDKFIIR